jgi:hypothetical protein
MNKLQRKILLWLFALVILCPIGLYLPQYFHSGDAWGEWDLKTIRQKTGIEPKGMVKNAAIWKAPVPDYKMSENSTPVMQSFHYIFSAVIGISLIFLITFILFKFFRKNGKTP